MLLELPTEFIRRRVGINATNQRPVLAYKRLEKILDLLPLQALLIKLRVLQIECRDLVSPIYQDRWIPEFLPGGNCIVILPLGAGKLGCSIGLGVIRRQRRTHS